MSGRQVSEDFECGNIEVLEQSDSFLKLSPRAKGGEPYTLWFAFRLRGRAGAKVRVEIENRNAGPYSAAFNEIVHPAYSLDGRTYRRMPEEWLAHKPNCVVMDAALPAEEILVAYGLPYTPSDLDRLFQDIARHAAATVEEIARSAQGRPVRAIRLSGPAESTHPRLAVVMVARLHAGEAPASFLCESMVRYLVQPSPLSDELLRMADWLVVPMVDVDGVANGLNGKWQQPVDFDRDWEALSRPEIAALDRHIAELADSRQFRLMLDLHAPTPPYEGKFYCYAPPDELLPRMLRQQQATLLRALEETAGNVFSPHVHSLPAGEARQTIIGRAALRHNALAVTIESPFHNLCGRVVKTGDWSDFGRAVLRTIATLF